MKASINLDEYFDRIYCINLKSRPDRLISFKKNFKALGTSNITFIEAIDGKTLDIGDWKFSPGSLGCKLSHLSIYNDALKNNYSKILVFEDDAIVNKYFRKALYKILATVNDDWDLIYFGGTHFVRPEKINNSTMRLKSTTTTHSMAINCRCMPQLLSELTNSNQFIDISLANLQIKLKVYGPSKSMAYQIQGYSDIEETNVNYNMSLMSKIGYKIKSYYNIFFSA